MKLPPLLATAVSVLAAAAIHAADGMAPVYLFCGAGDNLYNTAVEPVDSPAAIDAMLDYASGTYGIRRLYWRAIGDWAGEMKSDRSSSPISREWTQWLTYLDNAFLPDATAARLAHARGMEAFCYCGLFELGLQPDASAGYRFEFNMRRYHPEWIATDRWGERQEIGTLSYAIPEARAAMVKYFLGLVLRDGFDGINFYTYVENFAIHYEHEFGFDPEVVRRFNERYPDVDLRQATLTQEQAEYWYECRGHFVTLFLKELSTALHAAGKKLSMILDAEAPEYNQPWWGMPIRGNGKIRLDYETWIREGIVDELWVQLADVKAQRDTLDRLLPLVEGTPVKLTVRAVNPFDAGWEKYRQAGVSPIAVITWVRNGIEAYTRAEVTPEGLLSPDWRLRAQTLRTIGKGGKEAAPEQVLPLRWDSAVLVRRACYDALARCAANGRPDVIPQIEAGLDDPESCVRIAAALALQKANRAESAAALLDAVEKHPQEFQLFLTAIDTLKAIGAPGYGTMLARMDSNSPVIRKLAGFGLRKLAIHKLVDTETADSICARLQKHMADPDEDTLLRLHFIEQSIGMRGCISAAQVERLTDDVTALVESGQNWEVQLKAAEYSRHLSGDMAYPRRLRLKNALLALFRAYGDASMRHDAAYGWRDVGNSLVAIGCRQAVEELMAQREDAFLAYCAYQVLYDPQGPTAESKKDKGFNLIDEATAVENHRNHAPPFPGRRGW